MPAISTLRRIAAYALTLGAVHISTSVAAQTSQTPHIDGEFSVQRFEPVPGPHNYLGVAGARVEGDWAWSAGMLFDYQHNPFVITGCTTRSACDSPGPQGRESIAVVADMFTWNMLGSLTLTPIVQVGMRIPVVFVTGEGVPTAQGVGNTVNVQQPGLSGGGLGDLMLEGKVRVFGEVNDPVVLAVAGDLSAPLGHATSEGNYVGNATPLSGGIRGIVDFTLDKFSAAANLRGVFKENASFGDTTLGPELRYGVALGYEVHDLARVIAEGFGGTTFSSKAGTQSLEINGGLQISPTDGIMITAAGGTGIVQGLGVPSARVILGLTYSIGKTDDKDGDGVVDSEDRCPTSAEDHDGIQDEDGCPEKDADDDLVFDDVDRCPLKKGNRSGEANDDGCPKVAADQDGDGVPDDLDRCPKVVGGMTREEHRGCPDTDADGIPDSLDQCVQKKEDADGFQDLDGCPDPDNDADGIPDQNDECANLPETHNLYKDEDGCPDYGLDRDDDGIVDAKDTCASVPENLNGIRDNDGCPEISATLVLMTPLAIQLVVPIIFANAGSEAPAITNPVSLRVLAALASGLKNWTAISKIEFTVTAKTTAVAEHRAKAILAKLIEKGISSKRLSTKATAGTQDSVTVSVLEAPPWKK